MDIEHFPETNVILIHGREPKEIDCLRDQIAALAAKRLSRVAIHELPGFLSVDGYQLFACRADSDIGTRPTGEPKTFECQLRSLTWLNIEGLLEPFSDDKHPSVSHQYLDAHGTIKLIISDSKGW